MFSRILMDIWMQQLFLGSLYHLSFNHGLLVKYLLCCEETESGRRQEVMNCGAGRTFNKGLSM
jgi:hypothetical protein